MLLSFALQLYHLDSRTLHGDELTSVAEAADLGRNANSLPYFALLKLWSMIGGGEFWWRSISALAAVAAVAATFAWVRLVSNAPVARLTALLLATSSFLVEYGQQVRFYSLGLFSASLCLWAFLAWMQRRTLEAAIVWMFSAVLALSALLLNVLLLFAQMLGAFVLASQISSRAKLLLLGGVVGLGAVAIALPPVREFGFNALALYTNADSRYVASRGWTLSQVAKIPLTFFFFTFGESVYPLTYWLVPGGTLLFAICFVLGLYRLRRAPRLFTLVVVTGFSALALLYLVFDPLSPATLQGAAPRYLIFLLPLFYLVLAAGLQGRRSSFLIAPLLLVNAGSLASYWYGDWSYSDDLINWRAVSTWVGNYVTPQSLILLDGRAQETANYYFPQSWNRENDFRYYSAEDITPLLGYQRLILVADNFNPDPRAGASALIQAIEKSYDRSASWSQYPLFVYVFDHKPSDAGGLHVDAGTGVVTIPVQVYGLEFQDVRLPVSADVGGESLQTGGAFALPGPHGEQTEELPLDRPVAARRMLFLSTVTGAGQLPAGMPLANLKVTAEDGSVHVFSIRLGYESAQWNRACLPGTCTSAYRWLKRVALLGNSRYPESWEEFEASIFSANIQMQQPTRVQALEVQRVPTIGTLYIWGLVLAP